MANGWAGAAPRPYICNSLENRMKNFVLLLVAAATLLFSCSTDVDINAPYKPITVVYGLLDPVADTQWVKINKTFIGEGNNLEYAMIRDSSEYNFADFTATVSELDGSNVVNTFTLDSLTIHDKDVNGIFYAPYQTVYYFETPSGLNTDHQYLLNVDFSTKEDVSSSTELVKINDIFMVNPIQNSGQNLFLAQKTGENSFVFKTANIRFIPVESAPFYEITLRLWYNEKLYADIEHNVFVSEEMKFLDYYIGSYNLSNINSVGQISASIAGESYFSFVGSNIEANPFVEREIGYYDQSLSQPATRCFDLIINAGGQELNTFTQVNAPVTGIIQERPFYTNVTNGLGLFSSRSVKTVTGVNLINQSGQPNTGVLLAFVYSTYTNDLGFCDPDFTNSEFYCGN